MCFAVIIISGNYILGNKWTLVTDNFPQGLQEYYEDKLWVTSDWLEVSKQITVLHCILFTILHNAHVSDYISSNQNQKKWLYNYTYNKSQKPVSNA